MADAKLALRGFTEDIMEDTIVGQNEPVPIKDREYLLQMIVSLDEEIYNPNSGERKYKVRRCGAMKLTRIPEGSEVQNG